MESKIHLRLVGFTCMALIGLGSVAMERTAEAQKATPKKSKTAAKKKEQEEPKPSAGFGGPGGPGGPVFGEVVAVRGNVLQMRGMGQEGLTRVILASDAKINRDTKLKVDVLKPGMKVTGSGRQVEGTGVGNVPLLVEVQSLQLEGGGGPDFDFYGGPLMRGKKADLFRKQSYAGTLAFDAKVKSINPVVLVDEDGKVLPVTVGADAEVHERKPRPLKQGDITAGARVLAIGSPMPDGLLKANMIMMMGEGHERNSMPGTVVSLSSDSVTIRPRFEPRDNTIKIAPSAKYYDVDVLDLDTIQVGDTMLFTGKLLSGSVAAPVAFVVQSISREGEVTPPVEQGGGDDFFGGGGSATVSVKGKITGFDPLMVQTNTGREVKVTVAGQIAFLHYRPVNKSAIKAGQKVLLGGRSKNGKLVADTVILNPPAPAGFGF